MTISVGDKLPEATFNVMTAEGPGQMTTGELFDGRKVVLFAVPGAFTPTCHMKHLPGFISHAADLKAKGVDTIACVSVNDVFVMNAWAEQSGAKEQDHLPRRRQRQFHQGDRHGARCVRFRHGHSLQALCDAGG